MRSFRLYMLSLMKDKVNAPFDKILKGVLLVISWIYGLAIRIVDYSYTSGFRKKSKAKVPVISVGNITLGGTGKTPFTIFLAEYLQSKGKKVAILIRGYGQDESRMITDEVSDVPVFVGQNRVKSAQLATEASKDVLLLDDGFQHRKLARDLNIVLINASEGLGNNCLFPRGVLRERPSALARADIIVLTKTDGQQKERIEEVSSQLREIVPDVPIVLSRHKPFFLTDVTGAVYGLESLAGSNILAVSAIGDPDYFIFMLERAGSKVVSRLNYPDHYSFSQRDVAIINKEIYDKRIDKVIVTKKDLVKLKNLDMQKIEDKLFVLDIIIEITQGEEKLLAGLNRILLC